MSTKSTKIIMVITIYPIKYLFYVISKSLCTLTWKIPIRFENILKEKFVCIM